MFLGPRLGYSMASVRTIWKRAKQNSLFRSGFLQPPIKQYVGQMSGGFLKCVFFYVVTSFDWENSVDMASCIQSS